MKEFREAAANNNTKGLAELMAKQKLEKEGINERDEKGRSALHLAALNGSFDAAKLLVEAGADINCLDNEQDTPLCLAVLGKPNEIPNLNIIELLIKHDAKTFLVVQKHRAKTPLVQVLRKMRELEHFLTKQQLSELTPRWMNLDRIIKEKITKDYLKYCDSVKEIPGGIKIEETGWIDLAYKGQGRENTRETVNHYIDRQARTVYSEAREHGKLVRAFHRNAKPHYIPPLVFLMNHDDSSTFDIITRNFHFLKSLGYSRIAFEFDFGLTLDQTLATLELGLREVDNSNKSDEETKAHNALAKEHARVTVPFLKSVKAQNSWLTYRGIDLNLGVPLRSSAKFAKNVDKDIPRDIHMTQQIIEQVDNSNGGTIIILGLRHVVGIFEHLKVNFNDCFKSFLFFAYHQQTSQGFSECEKLFPEKAGITLKVCDVNKVRHEAASLQFRQTVVKRAFDLNIISSDEQLQFLGGNTGDGRKLNEVLGLPACREAVDKNGNVDAFFPMKDSDTLRKAIIYIKRKVTLAEATYLTPLYVNHQLYLVLPFINSKNSKPISESFERHLASKA